MPNRNYISGRAYEYKVKRHWESQGYVVLRSAGSRGPFDLVALPGPKLRQKKVVAIQCKRGKTEASALRLINDFKTNPPLGPASSTIQWITVWTPLGEEWGWI
jgi:hypothetical protein